MFLKGIYLFIFTKATFNSSKTTKTLLLYFQEYKPHVLLLESCCDLYYIVTYAMQLMSSTQNMHEEHVWICGECQ